MKRAKPFSIILIMIATAIIGCSIIPKLRIQYTPVAIDNRIEIEFYYNAPALIVESNVTSIIERAVNSINGVESVSSLSYNGCGIVTVEFANNYNMEMARFDLTTRIREIRDKLPSDVTPFVGGSVGSKGSLGHLLSYNITSPLSNRRLEHYTEKEILVPLRTIKGVERIEYSGKQNREMVIEYIPDLLESIGITPWHIEQAIRDYLRREIIGINYSNGNHIDLYLDMYTDSQDVANIPIKSRSGETMRLSDIASIRIDVAPSNYYYRIDGLSTIRIDITATDRANILQVSREIKECIEEIRKDLPSDISITPAYDASISLTESLHRVLICSAISLVILFFLVLIASRSLRYLFILFSSILVNITSALTLYYIFNIDINPYSMVGITISIGIIIDVVIVALDHYTYSNNLSIIGAIIGATLTTILALVLLAINGAERDNGTFIWVVVINLTLSVLVATLLVPAMLHYLPLKKFEEREHPIKRLRTIICLNRWYKRYIIWGRRHRWIYLLCIILLFGLPLQLLPRSLSTRNQSNLSSQTESSFVKIYNRTIGGEWYREHRATIEVILGGVTHLFTNHIRQYNSDNNLRESSTIHLRGALIEGDNPEILNKIALQIECWLVGCNEVAHTRTEIFGNRLELIATLHPEYVGKAPHIELKEHLWQRVLGYGAVRWQIAPIDRYDRYLSNNVHDKVWPHTLSLKGYNYNMLHKYATNIIHQLESHPRVVEAGLATYNNIYANYEYSVSFDNEMVIYSGIELEKYIEELQRRSYHSLRIPIRYRGEDLLLSISPEKSNRLDLWHSRYDMIEVEEGATRLTHIGDIERSMTDIPIERHNQEYILKIGYNLIGSYINRFLIEDEIREQMNRSMPMGFQIAPTRNKRWSRGIEPSHLITLLSIIVLTFIICASIFESIKEAVAIIIIIPTAFIGLLISYPLFDIEFNQGGVAAMVMLCGIVVNSGIYITTEYNTIAHTSPLQRYLKALNRKMFPTMLTIISTILGLIPFVVNSCGESFWHSFSVGVMGGMGVSIPTILFVMPIFFNLNNKN